MRARVAKFFQKSRPFVLKFHSKILLLVKHRRIGIREILETFHRTTPNTYFSGNVQRGSRRGLTLQRIQRGRKYLLHSTSGVYELRERRQQHTSHGSEVVYVDSRPLYDPGTYDSYCARSRNERSLHDLPLLDRRIADPPVQRSIDREQRSAHTRGYLAAPSIWLRFHRCGSNRGEKTHTRCAPRASPRLDLPRLLGEETNVIGILDSDHGTLDRPVTSRCDMMGPTWRWNFPPIKVNRPLLTRALKGNARV